MAIDTYAKLQTEVLDTARSCAARQDHVRLDWLIDHDGWMAGR
jgi:hypothetical protein